MWLNLSLAEDNITSAKKLIGAFEKKAKEIIDTLEEEMTPEQIEEAQKLSRDWFTDSFF